MGDAERSIRDGRLIGVLVTFRRPHDLAGILRRLADQERGLDHLIVVDNDPAAGAEAVVRDRPPAISSLDYRPMSENLGFTGGVAEGMKRALEVAADDDWIVVLDDDDPPPTNSSLADVERFALEMLRRDPRTASVGLAGSRFDWRRGRISRVPDRELRGAVPVDFVSGNNCPFYLVRVVRSVGTFHAPLFFGLSEVEYGLRLRRAGYSIYAHGDLWLWGRQRSGRTGAMLRPGFRLSELGWRRYYVLRNTIFILRLHRHPGTALLVTVVKGLGKPLANLVVDPRAAIAHLRLNWRACRDGWRGRMGRVIQPDSRSRVKASGRIPGQAA